jgi:hypothetical protein
MILTLYVITTLRSIEQDSLQHADLCSLCCTILRHTAPRCCCTLCMYTALTTLHNMLHLDTYNNEQEHDAGVSTSEIPYSIDDATILPDTEPKTEPNGDTTSGNTGNSNGGTATDNTDGSISNGNDGNTSNDKKGDNKYDSTFKTSTTSVPAHIKIISAPKCIGRDALQFDDNDMAPLVIEIQTPAAAADTTFRVDANVVRGQYPIDTPPVEIVEPEKKKNVFRKMGSGIKAGYTKAVAKPVKKQLDKLARIEGDGKDRIKNPVGRFIGKQYTKHKKQ